MTQTLCFFGMTACCVWTIVLGWRYHAQMKAWRRRATLAEHVLHRVYDDLIAEEDGVREETSALVAESLDALESSAKEMR
jgi:hypothetical protein